MRNNTLDRRPYQELKQGDVREVVIGALDKAGRVMLAAPPLNLLNKSGGLTVNGQNFDWTISDSPADVSNGRITVVVARRLSDGRLSAMQTNVQPINWTAVDDEAESSGKAMKRIATLIPCMIGLKGVEPVSRHARQDGDDGN